MIKIKESNSVGTHVEFNTHELMFLGLSGQPYRGQLFIQYYNKGVVIDLVSLKKYIESLRSKTILLEDISFNIYSDLYKYLKNDTLCVVVKTTPRGGISSTIKYGSEQHPKPESKPIIFGN